MIEARFDNLDSQTTDPLAAKQNFGNQKFSSSKRYVPLIFLDAAKDNFIEILETNLLSLSVSYTIDEASALSIRIIDPGFEMTAKNYFQPGQTIIYKSLTIDDLDGPSTSVFNASYYMYPFEIADVEYSQVEGHSPIVQISAYTKSIQQMKRDRTEIGSIKGTGTAFVKSAAFKYGLDFIGEQTSKSQTITKASGEQQADSLWDVIKNLAGDAKFLCFESDGILFFGSQKWLLHKWGVDSYSYQKFNKKLQKNITEQRYRTILFYPPYVDELTGTTNTKFLLQQLPTMQTSINDPLEASGSCIVDRINGVRLRPGMTVYVGHIPHMTGYYFITSVSFDEISPDPVAVQFRTIERLPKDIKQIGIGSIWRGKVKYPTNQHRSSFLGDDPARSSGSSYSEIV